MLGQKRIVPTVAEHVGIGASDAVATSWSWIDITAATYVFRVVLHPIQLEWLKHVRDQGFVVDWIHGV